jgi:hypothetical protein
VHTISTHDEPKVRPITPRAALAVGAVVVLGAFGAGFAAAPAAAGAAGPSAAVGHTFSAALTESLALKQHVRSRTVRDIRKRRIE